MQDNYTAFVLGIISEALQQKLNLLNFSVLLELIVSIGKIF